MPYNTSRNVCVRNERYFEELHRARGTDISWPVGSLEEAKKFARRMREALAAAGHHHDFAKYGDLKDLYELRARPGFVQAYWKGERVEDPESAIRPDRMEVPEAESVMGVVGAAIKFKDRSDEIYCPNAVLTDEEKLKLHKWCQTSGWKYIDQYDGGLTITQRRVDPILLFDPADLEVDDA